MANPLPPDIVRRKLNPGFTDIPDWQQAMWNALGSDIGLSPAPLSVVTPSNLIRTFTSKLLNKSGKFIQNPKVQQVFNTSEGVTSDEIRRLTEGIISRLKKVAKDPTYDFSTSTELDEVIKTLAKVPSRQFSKTTTIPLRGLSEALNVDVNGIHTFAGPKDKILYLLQKGLNKTGFDSKSNEVENFLNSSGFTLGKQNWFRDF